MAVTWTKSGLYNRIGVELVDVRNVNKSLGWFTGRVVGGTITEDYHSDYFSSASLEIDGGTIPLTCAVRIWHVAEDLSTGDTQRTELGTFWPEPSEMEYDHGRYHGTVEMHSALKRLGTDLRKGDGSVPKGSVVASKFSQYVKTSGGVPSIKSGVSTTKKLGKAHAWKHGESVLDECKRLASALGAEIGVDTHGRVVLRPYVKPSKRGKSFDVPRGTASMTEIGTVGYESNELYNRFIASYENSVKVQKSVGTYKNDVKYTENVKDKNGVIIHHQGDIRHHKGDTKYKTSTVKKKYYDMVTVSTSHPWHPSKIGRFVVYDAGTPTISKEGDENITEQEVLSELRKLVNKAKDEHANARKTWSATMLYWPNIQVGRVGTFYYQDNPNNAAISKKCFVAQREISLDGSMRMELTLEEL